MTLLSGRVTAFHRRNSAHTAGTPTAGDRYAPTDLCKKVVAALARTMTVRDASTHEHAKRVQRHASALAGELRLNDEALLEALDAAALLHDIGKLAIPDRLLRKPGPLTHAEYELVKQHAVVGAAILNRSGFPAALSLIVRHHHENWDGSGYPDRLTGDSIPIGSRVLSIIDCYDALTSERPYRRKLSHESAMSIIQERRGTMYDPAIADAFVTLLERMRCDHPAPQPGSLAWLAEERTT